MNYRRASVLADESASTAGTKTIDIKISDVISKIRVRYMHVNNLNTPTGHPAKIVSKIELVDGSDVLMSLSGQQAQALAFFDQGLMTPHGLEFRNDIGGYSFYDLNFGRYLYDPLLAFDPKKFKNPQLKITHDKSLGGSTPDDAYLEVAADIFDGKVPSPIGFLTSKEFYTYALSANAWKYIDLPSDYTLKRLLIGAQANDLVTHDQILEFEVSEDNDRKRPYDEVYLFDYHWDIQRRYGLFKENLYGTGPGADTYNFYCTPCDNPAWLFSEIGAGNAYRANERSGGYQDITFSASMGFMALITGFAPHGYWPIDFGKQDDHNDWFDVKGLGSLELRLKAGSSASGTARVITQQLRKY